MIFWGTVWRMVIVVTVKEFLERGVSFDLREREQKYLKRDENWVYRNMFIYCFPYFRAQAKAVLIIFLPSDSLISSAFPPAIIFSKTRIL